MDIESSHFSVTNNILESFSLICNLGEKWEDHDIEDQYKNQGRKLR